MKKFLAILTSLLLVAAMAVALVACNDDKEISTVLSDEAAFDVLKAVTEKSLPSMADFKVVYTETNNSQTKQAEFMLTTFNVPIGTAVFPKTAFMSKVTANGQIRFDYYGYAIESAYGGQTYYTQNAVKLSKVYASDAQEPSIGTDEGSLTDAELETAKKNCGIYSPLNALKKGTMDILLGDKTDYELTVTEISTKKDGYKSTKLSLNVRYTDDNSSIVHTLNAQIVATKLDDNNNYRVSSVGITDTAESYSYSIDAAYTYPDILFEIPDYNVWTGADE